MNTDNDAVKPLFQGEMMICAICGAQQKSDPTVMTQWRGIQIGADVHYVCPKHFPPDDANAHEFGKAYKKVFQHILKLPRKH